MSVYQLLEFTHSTAPQNGVIPNRAWRTFMDNGGPEFVPSRQTCFYGGISSSPHVSERKAGAIYTLPEQALADTCPEIAPNVCFAYPPNVFKRKMCACGFCVRRNDINLYR